MFRFQVRRRGGCLGGLMGCGLFICIGLFMLGIMAVVLGAIRSSEAYTLALAELQQNERALALLGAPIEDGWLVSGSISTSGDGGEADFTVPVSGSRQSGRLHVQARRAEGVWQLLRLDLEVNGERMALLGGR
ncbi:MAG: hypothetical protein KC425_15060 [Anaerolineales bacterium]|nr:hypothetical protein [Anaerolineales bacterium]